MSLKVLGITDFGRPRPLGHVDQREAAVHELEADQKLDVEKVQPHGGSNLQACG